jgi:hypothetical protein
MLSLTAGIPKPASESVDLQKGGLRSRCAENPFKAAGSHSILVGAQAWLLSGARRMPAAVPETGAW